MLDSQPDNNSRNKSRKNVARKIPAYVVCPACFREHHIKRGIQVYCECLQPLDPGAHKAEAIVERQMLALRPIPAERLREFLLDLANMPVLDVDDIAGATRLVGRFREFFPLPYPDDSWLAHAIRTSKARGTPHQDAIPATETRKQSLRSLIGCRNDLRRLWQVEDMDQKDWGIHLLREQMYHISAHPTIASGVFARMLKEGPPPRDALQQALLYFQAKSYLARICARRDCNHLPFFFAEKSNQQHCSPDCARASQSESKRRWWLSEGKRWRKARKDTRKGKGKR